MCWCRGGGPLLNIRDCDLAKGGKKTKRQRPRQQAGDPVAFPTVWFCPFSKEEQPQTQTHLCFLPFVHFSLILMSPCTSPFLADHKLSQSPLVEKPWATLIARALPE